MIRWLNLADDSDLDTVLKDSQAFVCMKCFTAYNMYTKKGKELYDQTADSANYILSHLLRVDQSQATEQTQDLGAEVSSSQAAAGLRRKRVREADGTDLSPSVSVSFHKLPICTVYITVHCWPGVSIRRPFTHAWAKEC